MDSKNQIMNCLPASLEGYSLAWPRCASAPSRNVAKNIPAQRRRWGACEQVGVMMVGDMEEVSMGLLCPDVRSVKGKV